MTKQYWWAHIITDDIKNGTIKNREQAARAYSELIAMLQFLPQDNDVAELNGAIKIRWSMAGLRYIKDRAWTIYKKRISARRAQASR